jgi:hypothetical protein
MSRTHEPLPVHAPLHAVNLEPASGVAVSVTDVPLAKAAEQTLLPVPQVIPAGVLVMFPLPVTEFTATDTVNGPADEPPVSSCWWGLHASSSVTVSVPVRTPLACGA